MTSRAIVALVSLAVSVFASAQNEPPRVEIKLPSKTAVVGSKVEGTVVVTFADGLHGYQNPPSESFMIPLTVSGDNSATKIVTIKYPSGEMVKIGGSDAPVATYAGETVVPVTFQMPAASGEVTLTVNVHYQQCNESTCFPPNDLKASVKVTLTPASTSPPNTSTGGGTAPAAAPVIEDFHAIPTSVTKGQPTSIFWTVRNGSTAEIRTPKETVSVSGKFGNRSFTFDETTTLTLVAKGSDGQEVTKQITITVAGSETPPTATTTTGSNPDTAVGATPGGTTGSEPTVPTNTQVVNGGSPVESSTVVPKTENTGLAGWLDSNFQGHNYALILLGALLVGLLLTLTPCVYPMIPITVGFFSNQAAESRAARLSLGAMYMVGIAITYGVAGGVLSAIGSGVGALFTQPWFLFVLAAIMVFLALSMFDVYEIGVPRFIGKHLRSRSGAVGALIMGLLMGFAAAPCAGALVSAIAISVANTKSIVLGVLVFSFIGLGLGLPFFALASLSTGAAKVLPKSGGWLKTVKAVMGLIVLGLAVDYAFKGFGLKSDSAEAQLGWFITYILGAAFLLFGDKSDPSKLVLGIKGTSVLALGLLAGIAWQNRSQILFDAKLQQLSGGAGTSREVNWIPYTEQSFEDAKKSGKPIMIDAGADWCIKCKEIEKDILKTPEGLTALKQVVTLRIDHSTGVDPAYISSTSKKFNINGLPHIMFFKAGGEPSAVVKDMHTVEELKAELRKAGASL